MKVRVVLIKAYTCEFEEENEQEKYEVQEYNEEYNNWDRLVVSLENKEDAIYFAKKYANGEITEDGNEVIWSIDTVNLSEVCPNHCDIHELQKPLPPILDKP